MGRAKSKMELISEEKARIITFKRRKEGLIRKIHELTVLCDVPACVIIYGPKHDSGSSKPETWPESGDEVRRVIDIYLAKDKKDSSYKPYGVTDFLDERKKKIEADLSKQKKKNTEAKYPTKPESMSSMSLSQLRDFGCFLKAKADLVKSRIEFLQSKRGYVDYNTMVRPQMQVPNIYSGCFVQNPNTIMMPLENGNYANNGDVFGCGSGFYDVSWDGIKPIIRYFEGAPYVPMGQQQQLLKMMNEGGIYGAPYVHMGQVQYSDEGGVGGDKEGFRMGYNSMGSNTYH